MPLTSAGFQPRTQSEWLDRLAALVGGNLGIVVAVDDQSDPLTRFLTALAEALAEVDLQTAGGYTAWDPGTAQRAQLDRVLRAFGTGRRPESASTVRVRVVGTPTLDLSGRLVSDPSGALWVLPQTIVGALGNVDVVAEAQDAGPVEAELGSWLLHGAQPTGFDSVIGLEVVTVGSVAEEDPTARERLALLRGNGSTTEAALYAAIFAVPGVDAPGVRIDNNRGNTANARGVPAKHVEALVPGTATADAIATALLGSAFYVTGFYGEDSGTATAELSDGRTLSYEIAYTVPNLKRVFAQVTLTATGAAEPLPADAAAIARGAVADYSQTLRVRDSLLSGEAAARIMAALPPQTLVSASVSFGLASSGLFSLALAPGARNYGRISNEPSPASILGTVTEPFAITAGWQLDLSADSGATQSVIFPAIAAGSAQDVADEINAAGLSGISAYAEDGAVGLLGVTTGPAGTLEIEGTSTAALLVALGYTAGTSTGLDTDVVSVTIV